LTLPARQQVVPDPQLTSHLGTTDAWLVSLSKRSELELHTELSSLRHEHS
jgi:hypothetical protein